MPPLEVILALLTALTTYSLVGIIAVWGALGRGFWFYRIAVVLLFVAAWLLAADDRLALLFLAQSTVVILGIGCARLVTAQRKSDEKRPRFALKDLLLAVLLLCGALAILAPLQAAGYVDWWVDIWPGAFLGCFTLVGVSLARDTKTARPLRVVLLLELFPSLFIGGWLWFAWQARSRTARTAAAVGLLVIAVLPARFYYRGVTTALRLKAPPPANNGFTGLLRAAEIVDESSVDIDKLSDDEARAYLAAHRPALELVETSLVAKSCQVLLPDAMNDDAVSDECRRLGKLAAVVAAQGRLQADEGRLSDAWRSYLATIEIGAATAHGGVMVHDFYGKAMEQLGVEGLQKIVAELDAEACRELGDRLAAIEAQREPLEDIREREKLYMKKTDPWKARLYWWLPRFLIAEDDIGDALARVKRARLRLLIGHLALRRWRLEGHPFPDTLDDLVPQYLRQVPRDPFGDRGLVYRRLPDGYRLYSIGPDLQDDGGELLDRLTGAPLAKGDVVVDPLPITPASPAAPQP